MKQLFLFIFLISLLFSCKKEGPYDPDQHITYAHWYRLSGSTDTLFSVYIPNAFTPNGDGVNDVFQSQGNFKLAHLFVYNRSGRIIFETIDINGKWDGRENNSGYIVQEGVYTYQFIVKDIYGADYEYTGSVMLYK